jgi:Sensors of blue-light using FAD.
MQLYQLIYTSVLAPDAGIDSVSGIIQAAQATNRKLNITGLLIFDGVNFCQHLEGPEDNVRTLAMRIARDPRHTAFTIRHESCFDGMRSYPDWSIAFSTALEGDLDSLLALTQGQDTLAAMKRLLPGLKIES